MTIDVIEDFGIITVNKKEKNTPIHKVIYLSLKYLNSFRSFYQKIKNHLNNNLKAYVKVFAKFFHGSVSFYRDGYTDLVGRFDYALKSDKNNLSNI